ncbi:MAG: right-handed parallel beta-helix repeat-containing protein [Fibrobacterales bacterium]
MKYCLLILLIAECLNANNIYLSQSEGNDANSGTSVEAPIKSISRLNYMVYRKRVVLPGDSILFKKGDAWFGEMIHFIQLRGTEEEPIVVSSYGSGANPLINAGYRNLEWEKFDGTQFDDVWLADLGYMVSVLQGVKGDAYYRGKVNVKRDSLGMIVGNYDVLDSTEAVTFVNTTLTEARSFGPFGYADRLIVRTPDGERPVYPESKFFGNGIALRYTEYIVVENLSITEGMDGIFIESSKNVTVQNCNIYEVLGIGIKVAGGQHNWKNNITSRDIYILNNSIRNTGNNSIYVLYTDHIVIRGNDLSEVANSPFGLATYGDQCITGFENCLNVVLEFNYAHDNNSTGHFYDPNENYGDTVRYNLLHNARGFGSFHGGDITVHNNIFLSGNKENAAIGGAWVTSPYDISFENNMWLLEDQWPVTCGLHSYGGAGIRYSAEEKTGWVTFNNNVMYAGEDKIFWLACYQNRNTYSDYNIFYTPGPIYMQNKDYVAYDFDDFILNSGHDEHSLFAKPGEVMSMAGAKGAHEIVDQFIAEWADNGLILPLNRRKLLMMNDDGLAKGRVMALSFDNTINPAPFDSSTIQVIDTMDFINSVDNSLVGRAVGDVNVVSGPIGNALSMSGDGAYLNFGKLDRSSLEEFSISFIIAPSGFLWGTIFQNVIMGHGCIGVYPRTKYMVFSMDGSEGGSLVYGAMNRDLNWHHVVAVYSDMGARRAKLYVDGIAFESQNSLKGQLIHSDVNNPFQVSGRYTGYHWAMYDGMLDEMQLWNRAISSEEARVLYDSLANKLE